MTAYRSQTQTTLGQLCTSLWDSQSRPVAILPGIEPGSVVTPLALRCSTLDRCTTREPCLSGAEFIVLPSDPNSPLCVTSFLSVHRHAISPPPLPSHSTPSIRLPPPPGSVGRNHGNWPTSCRHHRALNITASLFIPRFIPGSL
jgi:hypothetical protein